MFFLLEFILLLLLCLNIDGRMDHQLREAAKTEWDHKMQQGFVPQNTGRLGQTTTNMVGGSPTLWGMMPHPYQPQTAPNHRPSIVKHQRVLSLQTVPAYATLNQFNANLYHVHNIRDPSHRDIAFSHVMDRFNRQLRYYPHQLKPGPFPSSLHNVRVAMKQVRDQMHEHALDTNRERIHRLTSKYYHGGKTYDPRMPVEEEEGTDDFFNMWAPKKERHTDFAMD